MSSLAGWWVKSKVVPVGRELGLVRPWTRQRRWSCPGGPSADRTVTAGFGSPAGSTARVKAVRTETVSEGSQANSLFLGRFPPLSLVIWRFTLKGFSGGFRAATGGSDAQGHSHPSAPRLSFPCGLYL